MRSPEKPSPKVADTLEQLAHIADGVFAVDLHHCIILWNRAAELWNRAAEFLLGYTAQEVLGRPCEDVIQGRDCNGYLTCGNNVLILKRQKSCAGSPIEMSVRARRTERKS